jgi:hypothetical protein
MAIRARVELRGSLTHDQGGRVFKKGSPQILSNAAEIKYYQGQAGFSVTMLDTKAKAPAPVVDDDDTGESDNDYEEADLRKMKKADLVEICEELELDTEGTVNELIDRILEAQ